jgi:hypothetical protein
MQRKQLKKRGSNRPPSFAAIGKDSGDCIVKRFTFPGNALATNAGTTIPITTVKASSVQAFPATEWASFASRYQQYRVRAIRVSGKATQPVQTAAIAHSVLYRGDYLGSATPGTAAQVLSDEEVKFNATCKDFDDVVTWKRNPNARLWNPTSAAVPTVNDYGWVCASPSMPALTTATTYYAYVVEWEVEFRGSQ